MQDIGMQFHIRAKEGDVGRYVFLPGDPAAGSPLRSILITPSTSV